MLLPRTDGIVTTLGRSRGDAVRDAFKGGNLASSLSLTSTMITGHMLQSSTNGTENVSPTRVLMVLLSLYLLPLGFDERQVARTTSGLPSVFRSSVLA